MIRRILIILFSSFLIFSLTASVSALDVPEDAVSVTVNPYKIFSNVNSYGWQRHDTTNLTISDVLSHYVVRALPLFVFGNQYNDFSTWEALKDNYTYCMEIQVQSDNVNYYDYEDFRVFPRSYFSTLGDPIAGSVLGRDIFKNSSFIGTYSVPGVYTFSLVFNVPEGTNAKDYVAVAPFLFMSGYTQYRVKMIRGSAYYDMNGSIYEGAVLEQLQGVKDSVDNGFNVTNENLENIDQSIIDGNEQAHQDSEDIKKAIEEQGQKEYDTGINKGNEHTGDAEDALKEAFNPEDYSNAFSAVLDAILLNDKQSFLDIPEAKVPSISGSPSITLWESQRIDFSPWLNNENVKILIIVSKFVTSIACVVFVAKTIMSWMGVALSPEKAAEPEGGKS